MNAENADFLLSFPGNGLARIVEGFADELRLGAKIEQYVDRIYNLRVHPR
jgi:hypothetical protein